jgi:DNA repair protein RadD
VIELRPHQLKAADAIEDAYHSGIKRPLVNMCVGSGKSLTMAELGKRFWSRGKRSIINAHTRELVRQNAKASRLLGVPTGINAAALKERTWRAPVISASINSVFRNAGMFDPATAQVMTDECHLIPHVESGMYREFHRGFPDAFFPGFSGTTFRMLGGSLTEGEGAPFDACVYEYTILDGIADGWLVPAFSAPADDAIELSQLRTLNGEYTAASQDVHNLAQMDNHIAQMVHHGADRRAWLVFEASQKAAIAMTERLRQWGVSAALVIDKTDPDERERIIADFIAGKIRCLVNVAALTTGFDAQIVDMVVLRRATKSLGLYIQMIGRLLRTIGGNIESSIAAGKADGLLIDFGRNVETHGPLDFIEPVHKQMKMVSCEHCSARNSAAAARCWSCDELMTKLCPACVKPVHKGTLDCPHCEYDMRTGGGGEERKPKLSEKSSGAELIASFAKVNPKQGGWIPIRKVWKGDGLTFLDVNGDRWNVPASLEAHASTARWVRGEDGVIAAILKRNGTSNTSALQVTVEGVILPVPMPAAA